MNNGLDQKKIDNTIKLWTEEKLKVFREKKGYENRTIIISSARLEPKNKFEHMLYAIPQIAKELPNFLWCIIGSGSEENRLRKIASELKIEKHVSFIGALYEEEKLAPYFLSSKLFVHPAAIGLGMMHAFGYGLPVIVNGSSHLHGPEYAAFTNELTGLNFIENDPSSLSTAIMQILNSPVIQSRMSLNVQKIAREQFNVDVMVERFVQIAKHSVKKSK
jgi:glycosyltransferase involved in cell wall biosynthesis